MFSKRDKFERPLFVFSFENLANSTKIFSRVLGVLGHFFKTAQFADNGGC